MAKKEGEDSHKKRILPRLIDSMPSIIPNKDNRKFGEKLRVSWIFEKVYEKIILVILCCLGVWKIYELLKILWGFLT
jgi:hypothetical protein